MHNIERVIDTNLVGIRYCHSAAIGLLIARLRPDILDIINRTCGYQRR